jgi:hypothetical protein
MQMCRRLGNGARIAQRISAEDWQVWHGDKARKPDEDTWRAFVLLRGGVGA